MNQNQENTLIEKPRAEAECAEDQQAAALKIVEELYGSIKGLDRETIIWLAEDEELCGY